MKLDNQQIVQKLVDREVICCVSYLMSYLGKKTEDKDNEYADEIMAVVCPPAPDHSERIEELEEKIGEIEDGLLVDHAAAEKIEKLKVEIEGLKEEQDGDGPEVFEHWAVTNWAAYKLKEKGEAVENIFGLQIWGRTCSGQAISLDSVWEQIASDTEILNGQKYDWGRDDG